MVRVSGNLFNPIEELEALLDFRELICSPRSQAASSARSDFHKNWHIKYLTETETNITLNELARPAERQEYAWDHAVIK